MSEPLKPCPFCGHPEPRPYTRTCNLDTPYDPSDRLYPIVICLECGASANGKTMTGIETAIIAWNRRIECKVCAVKHEAPQHCESCTDKQVDKDGDIACVLGCQPQVPEVQSAEDFAKSMYSHYHCSVMAQGCPCDISPGYCPPISGEKSNGYVELIEARDAAIRAEDRKIALQILREYWPMGTPGRYEKVYERISKEVISGK